MPPNVQDHSLSQDSTGRLRGAADLGVLALVIFLPALQYLPGLGFYSDDWGFLQVMEGAPDPSVSGLFAVMLPVTELRPAHALYLALTHTAFGLTPLGHHLVNHLVMFLTLVGIVTVLRQLGLSRSLALTSACIFGLMPAYSTLRFWLSAQMINLSLLCYTVSLGLDLRFARASTGAWIAGRVLSAVAAAGSVLLYELCMPALLLNPFLAWWHRRRQAQLRQPGRGGARPDVRLFADIAINWTLVIAAAAFKSAASVRALPDEGVTLIGRLLRLARGVLNHHGVIHGIAEPVSIWTILTRYGDLWALLLAILIGVGLATYVLLVTGRSPMLSPSLTPRQQRLTSARVIGIGMTVLLLGYLIFASNDQFYFSAFGTANRIAQVGSLGVAIALAGAIVLLSTLVPGPTRQRAVQCTLVGLYGGAGALILMTIGNFWTDAYRRELAIVADIQRVVPAMPPNTTLLLDGECAYIGPGIVFESQWDLEGALRLAYRDWTLRANVISPRLSFDERAVSIWLTRPSSAAVHSYDEPILLYNRSLDLLLPIRSAGDLKEYVATFNPERDSGCPFGWPGNGVTVLPRS